MKRELYINQLFFALFAAITLFASCGEIYDLNGFDWEPDIPPSDSVFNREIQILDWGPDNVPEGHFGEDNSDPMLFSLEKFSSVHGAYKTSTRWDLTLGAFWTLIANNGSVPGYGYGSPAVGGIVLLDSAFSEVTSAPNDNDFRIVGGYGLNEAFGSGPGYFIYTGFGNPFWPQMIEWADSNDEQKAILGNLYKHMLYPFSEAVSTAFPESNYKMEPKTLIFRTANGNYAKLEVQSFYKGIMDPREMKRGNYGTNYMSFRYMVIRADERRFGFVARRPSLTIDMTNKTVTVGNNEK